MPSPSIPLNRDQPRSLPDGALFAAIALIVGVIGICGVSQDAALLHPALVLHYSPGFCCL